ncbi:polysaccharide export protein [Shinella sp. 838]|jgi:polysaccharide export outer membrane protein|uniref:polysaccharide biosynthesis/export family protein n=1 Tax=unclassified Shinella TaxID=2643062 RepID=UPI000437C3B0|nr:MULTISPECIES: polysaccharide biosynthesis/export family protein [unclassified Shinella]EYR80864.1 capsule polysaccharide exporter protein RkpU [Shinella sp. DD12]MDG4669909.1 polysaccharide export protein [Shinella sp. 838]
MIAIEDVGTPRRLLGAFARILAAGALLTLAGCVVPSDGPLTHEVLSAGADGKSYEIPQTKLIFDVVNVDQRVANSVSAAKRYGLSSTFGFGGGGGTPVIGVGDRLEVTIFEAGPDGLFSTNDRKSTTIPVIVQPDGHGQIPYVGSVRFAGMTIDSARATIVDALKAKAVEPDVIVSMAGNASRTVSIQGDVNKSGIVPLGLSGQHISEVIAMAGGAAKPPYDTYVSLKRGGKTRSVLLQSVIDNPKDDIYVKPDDQIYLTYDPQTFAALGQTKKSGKIPFDAAKLSLVEAAALAGGGNVATADPKGYFVFRYEDENVYRTVVGDDRFRDLIARGMVADSEGRYPIVYRLDLGATQSYIVAQNFPVRNKDVVYLARHVATDLAKFLTIVSSGSSAAYNIQRTADLL